MKITMNDIDFIYEDSERGITILVRTIDHNTEYRTAIKVGSIYYSCDWMRNEETYSNRVKAIIHTLNKLYQQFCEKDIVYYQELINTLADALEEAKKIRFQQLNLFEDGSTRKTYRVSKPIPKPSRREDKYRVSIYD